MSHTTVRVVPTLLSSIHTYYTNSIHTHTPAIECIERARANSQREFIRARVVYMRRDAARHNQRRESRPVNRATHYHKCPRAGVRPTRKSVSQIARVGLCHLPTVSFYRVHLLTRSCPSTSHKRDGWKRAVLRRSSIFDFVAFIAVSLQCFDNRSEYIHID